MKDEPPLIYSSNQTPSLSSWQTRFSREMQNAARARAAGNEGMARVCARRAAGVVTIEFFQRQGVEWHSASVYEALQFLKTWPGINDRISQVVDHLLVRLTPEHTLPVDADLLADALWLANELLGEQP